MRYADAVWNLPELRFPSHSYAEKSQRQKSLGPDGPHGSYVNSRALLHRRRHGGLTLFKVFLSAFFTFQVLPVVIIINIQTNTEQ